MQRVNTRLNLSLARLTTSHPSWDHYGELRASRFPDLRSSYPLRLPGLFLPVALSRRTHFHSGGTVPDFNRLPFSVLPVRVEPLAPLLNYFIITIGSHCVNAETGMPNAYSNLQPNNCCKTIFVDR